MASPTTIPTIFTAVDKFTRPVRKMSKGVSGFAAKAEIASARASRAFTKMMTPLRSLNRMLGGFGLLLGGALIVGAVGNAINVFKDFEQANATLASVMATATQPELQALQKDAKRLGAITAKSAMEVVGLQEAFARLGFAAPDIINMTEATIAGSIAMQGELSETAELVGAMVSSFDNFSSIDAPDIIDQLTRSTQQSALNFSKLQTALPIVAGAANAAKVPFNKLLASLGKLSDAGIDASSSSTALRNIFLEAAKRGVPYEKLLQKVTSSTDKLATANKLFGKRGAVAAVILAKNTQKTVELSESLLKGAGAQEAAEKQIRTLNGALTLLDSAYQGFILSVDDGTGSLSAFLTKSTLVIADMLGIFSGSAKARHELTKQGREIRDLAKKSIFWLKVVGWVIAALVAFKIAILTSSGALAIYKIGVAGITLVMKAWTAAQWLLNVALNANPIGLIIIGVAALIALVAVVAKKWDEWGAALSLFMGPLGFIISLIQSFRRNWEMVKEAFSTGGMLKGLLAIGKVILDAILMPVQQLLELVGKFTGLDIAKNAAKGLEKFRTGLGVETNTSKQIGAVENIVNRRNESLVRMEEQRQQTLPAFNSELLAPIEPIEPIVPTESTNELLQRTISEQRQNVTIDVNDNTGNATVESDNDIIPVNLSNTFAF